MSDSLSTGTLGPVYEVHDRALVNRFLLRYHYMHRGVPGWRCALTLRDRENELLIRGVIVIGTPCSRVRMKDGYLEVTRLCAAGAPKNAASYLLGHATRWAKQHGYRLVSYSDPSVGHTGTVYRAAGFHLEGKTKGGTWGNREGHLSDAQLPKDVWVWPPPEVA